MTEVLEIVALWRRARARGEQVFLATVVHVEGSAYRKPGARMLVTAGGEHAGGISGGCLEAEVTRRIGWLTRSGAVVQQYRSTFDDEGEDVAYGLGCGGTVWVLLESGASAVAFLEALEGAVERRLPSVAVVSLIAGRCGTSIATLSGDGVSGAGVQREHTAMVRRAALENRVLSAASATGATPAYVYTPITPAPRLIVFGAGDDARPLVRFAAELGWQVIVADGRSNLLRPERFEGASSVCVLRYAPRDEGSDIDVVAASDLALEATDFAVILTHSVVQDRALLRALLPRPLRYLGLLGPLHRTQRLVEEVAPMLGLTPRECLSRLHAPVGLDFGGGEASVIALSIVSELQIVLAAKSGSVERNRSLALLAS